jgi:hypothetical protein
MTGVLTQVGVNTIANFPGPHFVNQIIKEQ